MITFDRCLFDHYKAGNITLDDAMAHADSPNNVRLMAKLDKDAAADDDSDGELPAWVMTEDD